MGLTDDQCISFASKAVVGLIINRKEDNAAMGISFNNVANLGESAQFDLYAAYPIFNDEFICKNYLVNQWPIFYIACMPEFINSVSSLPSVNGEDEEEALDMVFWSIKDGDTLKSEAVIFGKHRSHIASIIEHSNMKIGEMGEIIQDSGGKTLIDADDFKHYG